MADDHVELLDRTVNCAVVRLPDRTFPGVVIQGDTLFSWVEAIRGARATCEAGNVSDAATELEMLMDSMSACLRNYERVLKDHDIRLPYFRGE